MPSAGAGFGVFHAGQIKTFPFTGDGTAAPSPGKLKCQYSFLTAFMAENDRTDLASVALVIKHNLLALEDSAVKQAKE